MEFIIKSPGVPYCVPRKVPFREQVAVSSSSNLGLVLFEATQCPPGTEIGFFNLNFVIFQSILKCISIVNHHLKFHQEFNKLLK